MGEGALAGMPLQLAGSRKMLEFMDWGDHIASGTFVKIGSIGSKYIDSKESKYTWCGTSKNLPKTCAKKVDEQDDIFTLVAPEKAVGYCDDLRGMTESAGNASGHPHQS